VFAGTAMIGTVAATAQESAPAAAPQQPAPPAAEAPARSEPEKANAASPAPAAAPAAPQQAAAPEADPIVVAARRAIGQTAGADKGDLAALAGFYGERNAPLWTSAAGFTPRAERAIAEIRKADDWGLEAKAFALPQLDADRSPDKLAAAEVKLGLAALKYARFASGGRIDPGKLSRFIDHRPTLADPKAVLAALASGDASDEVLTSFHPKHPQFRALQKALVAARAPQKAEEPAAAPPKVQLPDGPALKAGMRHEHVALLRKRLEVAGEAGSEDRYDNALATAVRVFQRENGLEATGTINAKTRAALNGVHAAEKKPSREAETGRIVLSMERWRWMPKDLGAFHVWDNVPEFMVRVIRGETPVHMEKIIVGKTNTPTPNFSANMQFIIFHPEWGVPDSIKVKEILPYLKRPANEFSFFGGGGADTRILQRHNLRVSMNGRPVDASQVDWQSVDVRQFQFIQPAGGQNVLGVVKFRFPNRHDVYMHDTPQRELFAQKTRTFSHGCMRVHNPQKLAEVLLGEDRGMSPQEVARLIASPQTTDITLKKQFPVHVTYMTAVVDDSGKLQTFPDVYGHDNRLQLALSGKQTEFFDPPEETAAKPTAAARPAKGTKVAKQDPVGSFLSGLFGN
jgi:murein L,D-transpeptidase YcbB/YkuD